MSTFNHLPLVGSFIRRIDEDLKTYGFQATMKNAVKKSGSKLIIREKTPIIEKILKHKPVVLVANHPFEAEVPAIIASLPDRLDTSLVVNSRLLNLSINLDKYLIPVYIDHHNIPRRRHKIMSHVLKIFHPRKIHTPEEAHHLNIQSIKEAAKRVTEGGLVIIFPGKRKSDGRWFTGVGHLLNQIQRKDVYIIRVFVEGTSLLDMLRLVPFMGSILPTITLSFATPLLLTEVWHTDPKKMTAALEKKFNDWVETLMHKED